MDEAYTQALKTNLEARKSERRTLAAKIQVLDKQINDIEQLLKAIPATKPVTKSATKSVTKSKPAKTARKSTKK